ncbi:MAG: ABC transporter ATP-binding protein/permease [Bacilli bacterium]|nr:ABC transporter ATP-binding protein/permease [Bacilli bacterium]
MINIRNLHKKYNQEEILKGIDLELPQNGLVVIYGPSGCGKTTLLNCLSGLLSFTGDIEIDGKHMNQLGENELNRFRINNIGFIFQDFKLFENESVINNVLFPIEVISHRDKESKYRKAHELLRLVGLKRKEKQIVSKLSGGEKQRVCIARSLINSPKLILADEPTGALDSKTAKEIMQILECVSKKSLVVIVSHDEELTKQYADITISMKDGEIIDITKHNRYKTDKNLIIEKRIVSQKKHAIPSYFLLHHAYTSMKQKKWRTLICNGVTSLGLLGVGLAITISSCISANIKKAYTSLIDESKVMVSLKEDNSIYGLYSGSYYEAIDIKNKYPQYIHDVGVDYIANYEQYFPDANTLAIADTFYYTPIEGISARHINEYKWLDIEAPSKMYPERIEELQEDEVVMGLSIGMIQNICFGLQIERSVESLSRYLINNTLKFYFHFANDSWQYDDEQIVTLKAFSLERNPCIYHSDHKWNEYMLETRMRFPTSDNLSANSALPWILKKIYYFQLKDSNEEFLSFSRYNEDFDPYILEIANTNYFPWLYVGEDVKDVSRIMFLSNTLDSIPPRYFSYFQKVSPELANPIYGTMGGYAIFPSSLMMGFSNYMYFSSNEESLIEVIDINTSLNVDSNERSVLPNDVLSGHYSQSMNGGVNFSPIKEKLIYGSLPKTIDEIVVSTSFIKTLTGSISIPRDTIKVAVTTSEVAKANGEVERDFKVLELRVVGIIDNDKNFIYQNSDWLISFFQSRVGVSAYYLGVNTIAMDVKNEKDMEIVMQKLRKAFPDYSIVNPLTDINASIDEVCGYIEIALAGFSSIAILISIMLLTISNYLHVLESQKEIGLARCIGINKKEARKFLYFHSGIMCLASFLLASVQLTVISFIISYFLGNEFGGGFAVIFDIRSIIFMFIFAVAISFISAFIMAKSVSKISPLEALKR